VPVLPVGGVGGRTDLLLEPLPAPAEVAAVRGETTRARADFAREAGGVIGGRRNMGLAFWRGETAEWRALCESFRRNCGACQSEESGALCAEHRQLVTGDQRYLDHSAFAAGLRARLVDEEWCRR
jgi:hypothetical protein